MNLRILSSGSIGNCSVIWTEQCRILVDCGLSSNQIASRLLSIGINPKNLDGIVITHEHLDHVKGLSVLTRKYDIPVYLNANTAATLFDNHWKLFEPGAQFKISDIAVNHFYVPHDAADPGSFTFTSDGVSVAIVTDLGYVPRLVQECVKHVNTLMIECNHDRDMLWNCTERSWRLKQRVLSRMGHLSNEQGAALAESIAGNGLNRVICAHLSQECNNPSLALDAMRQHGLGALELYSANTEISPEFTI